MSRRRLIMLTAVTALSVAAVSTTPSQLPDQDIGPVSASTRIGEVFEVASIKPRKPAPGGRGGPIGGCGGGLPQVEPSRFAVADTTLYGLVVSAYFNNGTPFVCPL